MQKTGKPHTLIPNIIPLINQNKEERYILS